MEKKWYETEADNGMGSWYATVPAPEAPEPPKKKRRWLAPVVALTLVAAIVLSCLFFGGRQPSRPDTAPEGHGSDEGFGFGFGGEGSGSGDSGFAFDWGGGKSSDGNEFADDFRDFFDNYYTSYTQAEPCDIPRVEAPKNLTISLREPTGETLSLQEIYLRCAPSIVGISAYPDAKNESRYSWGTGVILSSDGYIVTNSHVVEGTCRAKVTLQDDREFDANLVGNDSRSDIAVLKISAAGLTPAEFGNSEGLVVGDAVVALGNPLGDSFRCTMTDGIITGIGRDISYNGTTLNLLQTNAAINEGNSGGALINSCGQVIGITNMKMSNTYAGSVTIEGVGFAIPSVTVKSMADGLLSEGKVLGRPALGVTVGVIPDEAKEHYELPEGLYVSAIAGGSDAEGKLQVGDVITECSGVHLSVTNDLVELIAGLEVGSVLHMTVFRDGGTFETDIRLVDVNDVY